MFSVVERRVSVDSSVLLVHGKQARLRRRVLLQSGVRDRGRLAPSTQVAVAHHGHRGAMKDG